MSNSGHLVVKLLAAPTDGKRTVTGWCSTDDVDRVGDVVDPAGMIAKLPLPLLAGHDHSAIIGSITSLVPSANGVRIEARIVEGTAKADETWILIREQALTYFSIGFLGLKSEPLKGGGRLWKSWELTECSVVAVPANPNARITGSSNAKRLSPATEDPSELVHKNLDLARVWFDKEVRKDPRLKSVRLPMIANRFAQLSFHSAMKRIADLEKRLADVPKYRGVFNRADTYERADCVTHGGSTFFCLKDGTTSAPTHEDDKIDAAWQLMVKRGRDARSDSR